MITIGIATWNRADLLQETLESLMRLKTPTGVQWEILVCDNNSTDDTRSVVESMADRLPITYLRQAKQGLGWAHTKINENARGDWLLILDDDVLVDPMWLQAFVASTRRYPQATFFGGQVLPRLQTPLRGQARFLLEHFPWVHAAKIIKQDTRIDGSMATWLHGPNMAFRRDILSKIGFDPDRGMIGTNRVGGEDSMLTLSFLERNQEGWLLADYNVLHYTPSKRTGFRWFWNWHKQGWGQMRLMETGPLKPGKFGYLWLWKLLAVRFIQVAWRWPHRRRQAYEVLADIAGHLGHLQASKQRTHQPA